MNVTELSNAKKLAIIVDESKRVKTLRGPNPIPVEIVPFAYHTIYGKIKRVSEKAVLREGAAKVGPIVTANGNLMADACFHNLRRPDLVHENLEKILEAVETAVLTNV